MSIDIYRLAAKESQICTILRWHLAQMTTLSRRQGMSSVDLRLFICLLPLRFLLGVASSPTVSLFALIWHPFKSTNILSSEKTPLSNRVPCQMMIKSSFLWLLAPTVQLGKDVPLKQLPWVRVAMSVTTVCYQKGASQERLLKCLRSFHSTMPSIILAWINQQNSM